MDNTAPEVPSSQVTARAKIVIRAFPDDISLSNFKDSVITEAAHRLLKATRISSKLNSERPHDPNELRHAGLGWKSNFSTRPLNTLVSKQVGRFPRAISSARYLTSSALPADAINSLSKTEFFRDEFTKAIRADPRWEELVETVAHEYVTFGWCAAGWLDEDSWFPASWQQDSMFVPVNTKQLSSSSNAVCLKQALLPSEAFELLESAQLAEDGRWRTDLLAQSINEAMPQNQRASMTSEYGRLREELLRGLQLTSSYTGAKTVLLYHVLAQELNGKVSHYTLNAKNQVVFKHEDRFPNMLDTLVFFAWERGDRTLMGSKGIGRAAYTMSSVIDRNRNDAVDRLQLSGKLFVKAASANHAKFKMFVLGPCILIDENFEIQQQKIESDPSASIELDKYLGQLLDEMTGSASQASFEDRERVTKGEVDARLAQEGERTDDFLMRWLRQMGYLISGVQKRILNPEIPVETPGYEAAKKLMARLLTRLSPDEIAWLRDTPALSAITGWTPLDRANIVAFCNEGQGNPMYDQQALATAKASAMVSPDFSQQVVLPVGDPTNVAEQTRQQMLENDLLLNNHPVPVSPRDNHVLHIQTLIPLLQNTMQEALKNPTADDVAYTILGHGIGHVQAAQAGGDKSEVIAQADQTFQQIAKQLTQMKQKEAAEQAKAEQEAAAQDATAAAVTTPVVAPDAQPGVPVAPPNDTPVSSPEVV